MLCLSLREPWVTAIFKLGKNVENRTWRTNFRGQLGIHVSSTIDTEQMMRLGLKRADLFPLGHVVGFVELYDIVSAANSKWAIEDQWHWLIRTPIKIRPVRWRGQLNLFQAQVAAIPLRLNGPLQ